MQKKLHSPMIIWSMYMLDLHRPMIIWSMHMLELPSSMIIWSPKYQRPTTWPSHIFLFEKPTPAHDDDQF